MRPCFIYLFNLFPRKRAKIFDKYYCFLNQNRCLSPLESYYDQDNSSFGPSPNTFIKICHFVSESVLAEVHQYLTDLDLNLGHRSERRKEDSRDNMCRGEQKPKLLARDLLPDDAYFHERNPILVPFQPK